MNSDFGQAVLKSLETKNSATKNVHKFQLIETHISWVVMDGEFAWKIKKPVDLGFADFSSLEKRLYFCHEEIRINRRLAPDLYLSVVPITGDESTPLLEGTGEPIDYAVKMQQFPQEGMLDEVLSRDELTIQHIDDLANTVALFHQQIDVASVNSRFGKPAAVWQPVEENFEFFDKHVTDVDRRDRLESIHQRIKQLWESLAEICSTRLRDGFVRECHGDMHLGNMVLLDKQVTIFDAIDFNEAFRWIDVMNEVAFVVMDLERRERKDLAYRFLNRYCELTGDYEGIQLLGFYIAYRALIRAKVTAIRLEQQEEGEEQPVDDTELKSIQQNFDSYVNLAFSAIEIRKPRLIITHGLSGCGKTTFTQALLEQVGGVRVRSDVERKRMAQQEKLAGNLYSADASQKTYKRLRFLAEQLLNSRLPVIVDATFLKRDERERFRQLAAEQNADFTIIDLQAPVEVLKSRVHKRQTKGTDVSDADAKVIDWQIDNRESIETEELESVFVVDTTRDYQPQIKEFVNSRAG